MFPENSHIPAAGNVAARPAPIHPATVSAMLHERADAFHASLVPYINSGQHLGGALNNDLHHGIVNLVDAGQLAATAHGAAVSIGHRASGFNETLSKADLAPAVMRHLQVRLHEAVAPVRHDISLLHWEAQQVREAAHPQPISAHEHLPATLERAVADLHATADVLGAMTPITPGLVGEAQPLAAHAFPMEPATAHDIGHAPSWL